MPPEPRIRRDRWPSTSDARQPDVSSRMITTAQVRGGEAAGSRAQVLCGIYAMSARRVGKETAHIYFSRLCTACLFISFVIVVSASSTIIEALIPDIELEKLTGECWLRVEYTTRCDTRIYLDFVRIYATLMIFVCNLNPALDPTTQ